MSDAASTASTVVHAVFAGRRRRFCLRLGEIEDLERLCGAGIGEITLRVAGHRFRAADLRETIRLGLEGGGLDEATATALVMGAFDGRPLAPAVDLASQILVAAISGVPADDEAGLGKATAESEDPATSPPSSPPEAPSASGPTPSGR